MSPRMNDLLLNNIYNVLKAEISGTAPHKSSNSAKYHINFWRLVTMQQTIKSEVMSQKEIANKNIAIEFMGLIGSGRFKEGLRFCAPDCRTHNPYTTGGMEALTDAMVAAKKEMSSRSPNAEFSIKHVLADGDMVAVHTQILVPEIGPAKGG